MPLAQTMPSSGFQAFILCGPGLSLNTFTSSPEEFPKALVPIANRPMIWYPLDWCYRMGIITPSSASAIDAALSQNPHLTSLPSPKADVLSPKDLSQNTGTAEILRIPEIQDAILGDFVILPCDLICELGGESLLETWMIQEAGLGGVTGGTASKTGPKMGLGGEKGGRRGGLGVWYETKGEVSVKGEETDFVATSILPAPAVPPPPGSLRPNISNLVYSLPTDTLNDITEERKSFPIRHSLLRRHSRMKMLTSHRDAHVYFFPYWVLEMIKRNEKMDSISEDVVGWWAKAGWQDGLGDKLGLRDIFEGSEDLDAEDGMLHSGLIEEEIDLGSMSSTWTSDVRANGRNTKIDQRQFASRVQDPKSSDLQTPKGEIKSKLNIPPMLAYIHPSRPQSPLIRRVDTAPLLLTVSLHLAKYESIEEKGKLASSPFAHTKKIAYPGGVAQRCTVSKDCLLAENVTVEEKAVIKESVIGANCRIESGARLTRCLLMDGAIVGEKCQLNGCILGRRSKIGRESLLRDCEVQEGNIVPEETDAKNEKFMIFEGLEDEDGGLDGDEGSVFDIDDGNDIGGGPSRPGHIIAPAETQESILN
ncbi:MAG: hypothetical protein M1827_006083 [Pycnora praestabilis]|nr:MAG: hypothetical protein M1827_006083 [Pycnora praestabilis]